MLDEQDETIESPPLPAPAPAPAPPAAARSAPVAPPAGAPTRLQLKDAWESAKARADTAAAKDGTTADDMLDYQRQTDAAKAALDAFEGVDPVTGEPAPPPGDLASFRAPWEITGQTITPTGQVIFADVARALPSELYPLARTLAEHAVAFAKEAKDWPAPKRVDELEDALQEAWGREYDMRMDYAEAAWDLLGAKGRAEAKESRLHTHPAFWREMWEAGFAFLQTARGREWRLAHPVSVVEPSDE